jgi:hypothetical protein
MAAQPMPPYWTIFMDSTLWELIRQRTDTLLLEVWAGGDAKDHCDGRRLTLATPEAYDQLSHKTHRMLRWCSRQLRSQTTDQARSHLPALPRQANH